MHRRITLLIALLFFAIPSAAQEKPAPKPQPKPEAPAKPSPGAGPVIVIETSRGTIEFETYPEDAPKTVEHILTLVRRRFYNGLRIHRSEENFVIQMGDPQTRDYTKRELWGSGPASGSGKPVGVAEFSKRRPNIRGAVGMAHAGDPRQADSQFYILRRNILSLNGKYVIFGQVLSGMNVVDQAEVGDVIKRMYLKGGAR
ncbi:MAG TPA: peptidylprolyl isomerase [Vicinamibacterales bacterium]|nr:peptidylprolyl isomerase [Vicinamibacterales bacterium]